MNIVEIASASDDFNLLVRALQAADLVNTIQNADDITVFAPTDAAFGTLAQNLGFDGDVTDEDAVFDAIVSALTELGNGDPIPLLTDILLYHVASGARTEPTINASTGIDTLLTGGTIMPDGTALGDAEPDLADPVIVIADIMADNGIIQAIDNVLLPIDLAGNDAPANDVPTITGLVAQSGTGFDQPDSEFDILLAAVQAAGLGDALDAMDADLTVFAPNDAAFVGLAQSLGFDGTDEAGAFDFIVSALTLLSRGDNVNSLLESILTYHVSPGAKDSAAVTGAATLSTLAGPTIVVDGEFLVDKDPDLPDPKLLTADLQAANGIVHEIDSVLLPLDLLPSDGSDSVNLVFGSDADGTFEMGLDNDFVDAGGGNDTISGEEGNDVIVGGDGVDTAVFAGNLNDYTIGIFTDGVEITDNGSARTGIDFLAGIEALSFADDASFVNSGTVNLEVLQGASGFLTNELVELYVAYFDRAPDALGLRFWGNAMAEGVTLREIAELFFDQPETQAKLPDTLSSVEFVNVAYNHVLERGADDAGRDFWVDVLDSGDVSRAEFMLELIGGARANGAAADDVRTIEDKTELGVSYSLLAGLSNVENAATVMNAYMRSDAEASFAAAQALIEGFSDAAPGTELIILDLVSTTLAQSADDSSVGIVGAVDDPFMA